MTVLIYPFTVAANTVGSKDIKFLKELGEGAFGMVYLGHWKNPDFPYDHEVAVKVTKDDQIKPATRKEFEREAELMTALTHENIVTFYGICSEESHLFLVFEFMVNGDLNNYLRYDFILLSFYFRAPEHIPN